MPVTAHRRQTAKVGTPAERYKERDRQADAQHKVTKLIAKTGGIYLYRERRGAQCMS